ncbi:MAG TPA: phospholipase D-like domain-containing protein [Gammaproteobacteria bacterium]|nr:phospholipase D-like domain-containing protein [Gammaproteobacteria bacterium]
MTPDLDTACRGCIPTLSPGREPHTLYTEGDVLYDTMLEAIAGARHRVWLESYIFADDAVGRRFAEALAERAQAGCDVRLHIDAAGSLFWVSRRLERDLRNHGVKVRWFHRWHWRRPWRYNRRNHRKLLVVDNRAAFVGGYNIHLENSRRLYGEGRWRDTHVRLTGRYVREAAALFKFFWRGRHRWSPPWRDQRTSVLMPNYTQQCSRVLRCAYAEAFRDARHYIYLTSPYFVPDHRTQNGMITAAQRGVDVRLLVPAKSDVPITRWAARAAYQKLLDGGVRIFEYLPRVLQAKTALADGRWAMVGTANLDYRSLFLNYELNLISRDELLCRQLHAQFMSDLAQAEEIVPKVWAQRPWLEHVAEAIGWFARRWL